MPTYRRRRHSPGHQYRDHMRGIRIFLGPEHEGLLDGPTSEARIADLEALYELVMGVPAPRPPEYRPQH